MKEYSLLRGDTTHLRLVPIEGGGGEGTRLGHWRETTFDNELMTGWVEEGNVRMPLSKLTTGALRDLGYTVDESKAEEYRLPMAAAVAGRSFVRRIRCGCTAPKREIGPAPANLH